MFNHCNLKFLVALLLLVGAVASNAQEKSCNFDDKTLSFAGIPLEQAKCLLRKVKIRADLEEQNLPILLESLIDQKVQVSKQIFRAYLKTKGINENEIGGSLDEQLSRGRNNNKNAPFAKYFVIHDTSFNLCEVKDFPKNINDSDWIGNKLTRYAEPPKDKDTAAHLYITRDGKSIAPKIRRGQPQISFAIPWRATRLESDRLGYGIATKGLFLHIENVQPRHCRLDWINEGKCRDSKGECNDNIAPEIGFTEAQLERLALVYIAASIRRGQWLIPAFHAAVDAGISGGHDDPQNFDLQKWSDKISSILKELNPSYLRFDGTNKGTLDNPIIDSQMSDREAFDGLPDCKPGTPKNLCPEEIRKRQRIVTVKYYSSDALIHQGQLVIDKDLVDDIEKVFKLALEEKFPIKSVIPMSHKDFRKDGRWDDNLSMEANNTSAFNYRLTTGGGSLSKHATGRAFDINTRQNPYIKGSTILPKNGKYDPSDPGTLTADHPNVKLFLKLGWTWGGNWASLKDYQHFEKP
jgi:peptidoglycan L-alanyl-D-glutamate endopeptidase CwlK